MSAPRRNGRLSALAVVPVAALALASLAACGSSTSAATGSSPSSTAPSGGRASSGVATVDVTMSGDSCALDASTAPAGPITFNVTNQSATAITEVELLQGEKIVGEKENLAPGLPTASFTLTLGGGVYTVYCPGASQEKTTFTVTGAAAAGSTGSDDQLLTQGTQQYAGYVTTQVQGMVTAVKTLRADVDEGHLAAAQRQYAEARPFYEKIESDVDGFVLPGFKPTDNAGNLDYLIDMRASNLDPAVGWSGFHAIERDLFGRQRITPQTKKYAAGLVANVTELGTLSRSLTYKPEDLANGAAGLLEEVQSSKISGEEEAFSHIDLVDFAANVEGAQQAFADLQPGLAKIDPTLSKTVVARFAAVDTMLNKYRDPRQIGGFVRYSAAIKKRDASTLSQTVQALQDALSGLAEKVATA